MGCLAASMAKHAELGLVHLSHPGESVAADDTWRWRRELPYVGSPPSQGRAAHRMRLLWRWRSSPLLAAKHWHPDLPGVLAEARRSFAPDVALVELVQMAQYLPYLRGVPTVLTDHEAGIPANQATGLGRWADHRDRRLWMRHLRDVTASANLLQALTEDDASALATQLGRPVEVRAPALSLPREVVAPASAGRRALFLGDFRHEPNRVAAARLVRAVLPELRRSCADAELWLAGGHEDPIRHLENHPGVRVCGFVPDLTELFAQVRLVLAPLWSGSGFRVKTATALAYGLPVVTNALGARGLPAPPPACTVAESDAELAAAAAVLLENADLAARAGRAARAWAIEHLDPEVVAARQLERLARLLANRT